MRRANLQQISLRFAAQLEPARRSISPRRIGSR